MEDFLTVYDDKLSCDESNFEFSDNDIYAFAMLFMELLKQHDAIQFLLSRFPDAYMPTSNILCRCAYVTETVMINEVLDTVTIVVFMTLLRSK